jgi:hypothetical protein
MALVAAEASDGGATRRDRTRRTASGALLTA